jgi:hypothetical protein
VCIGLNASLARDALIMTASIGTCSVWWLYGFQRKLTRREHQKTYFIDALREFDLQAP